MMFRQPWLVPVLAASMLAACSRGEAPEAAAVSAAVITVPVRQGGLPEQVVAYGTAGSSPDAAYVMNVQAAGHVAHWDVTAGLPVKRGQRLLTFALAPSSVAAYQQALSARRVAAAARTHTDELFAQQLATRDQKEQADKAWQDAQANLDALVQQQGRSAAMDVTAPFDGTVVSVDASQGDQLQPGAGLLTLQRGDGLVVTVGVERAAMGSVRSGEHVTLTPLDAAEPMHGTVRRVARALNPRTHELDVEVVPDGAPVSGEGFRAEITVGQWQGWLVPRDALQGDDADRYVFQVADGKAVRVPVKVLGESDSTSVVSGALDVHRPLVTVGATQLDDGMAVRAPAADAKP